MAARKPTEREVARRVAPALSALVDEHRRLEAEAAEAGRPEPERRTAS